MEDPVQSRILIVDDERSICFILCTEFENRDYLVDRAATGAAALEKIKTCQYDLVLLDLVLPDQDGLTVLKTALQLRPGLRVIMITGSNDPKIAVAALKLGAVDYLTKPLDINQVLGLAEELIKQESDQLNYITAYPALIATAKKFMTRGEFEIARQWLGKALAIDPTKPNALNLIGMIYEFEGDSPQAQKFYRAALALDPTFLPGNKNLERTVKWGETQTNIISGASDFLESF